MLIGFNIIAMANLVLLSIILLFKKPQTQANRILSVIVIYPIFAMLLNILCYKHVAEQYAWVFYLSYLSNFLWGPLFFNYIHLMLQKPLPFSYKQLIHYIPFATTLVFFIWLNFQPQAYLHDILLRTQQDDYPWQFLILDYMTMIQFFCYLAICHRIVRKRVRVIKETFSDYKSVSTQWLQEYIVIYAGLGVLAFFPVIIDANLENFLIYMPIASLGTYYYLVSKNINSPIVFTPEALNLITQVEDKKVCPESKTDSEVIYEDKISLAFKLENLLMEEKLYLNSELNIQRLADKSGSSVHALSRLINNHYNKNFFDYINYYRIEEAKKLLADPYQQKYTIDSIANQVGFNSRSAFYTAFKKNTNSTPSEHLKSLSNQN